MRTRIALALLLVAFFLGSRYFDSLQPSRSSSHQTSYSDFTLLSWNVGYFDYETDSRAHDEDLEHIASVIGEAGPDCVSLQEIAAPYQVARLQGFLGGRYPHAAWARGFRTDRYVVLLSRMALAGRTVINTRAGRDAIAATVQPRDSLPAITVVTCHADAYHSRRRRHYVNDLIQWHRETQSGPVLLAGDFNFDLSPVESSDLFTDDKKNDSEAYSLILENFRDLGREGGPTGSFDRRIDYAFLSGTRYAPAEFRVLHGNLRGRMDHHPLLLTLQAAR
ncbi:MAG: endonuclease/exonuclease/phosphatase family protein [Acidobacteriota bacterium]